MNESKTKKTTSKIQKKDNVKDKDVEMANSSEIEKALEKNNEEWLKRMLLLVLTMIIALLGID